jgi:phage virion morphogenesis protein
MRFNVTARTDGIEAIRHRFRTIERAPQKVLEQMGKEAVTSAQNRIRNTKTSPDGQPWAPWSMATQRANRGKGGSLLFRTGALLNSIQYRVSDKTLTVYSNSGYGKYHQFGTPKMPARPFLGWNQQDINKVRDILRNTINAG